MARDKTSLGFKHRNAFELLTAANQKTPKGEGTGYFTGILYLAPHDSAGGATVCPHSTPACREMCLAGAGMSGLPRQLAAKLRRTKLYLDDRPGFMDVLGADIDKLKRFASREGLLPALRLNGSSDILWEREDWPRTMLGLQRYDYTKVPLEHRRVDPGYHLTYSYEGPKDAERALRYLRAGHSVAIVVPEDVKHRSIPFPEMDCGWVPNYRTGERFTFVDGDLHDLRFLDPPGSIVLLKPKGRIVTSLVRPDFQDELLRVAAPALTTV